MRYGTGTSIGMFGAQTKGQGVLSYQHIYHAGNPADVHKHALLAWMLAYMTAKPKPMSYVETHAGRGLYDLNADEARKTGEAAAGVGQTTDWFDANDPYARVLSEIKTTYGDAAYPGSPMVAKQLLRATDTMHLAELHPQEYAALRQNMRGSGAQIHHQDGYDMAMSICPPTPRRGLAMIDPSYEIKDEYAALPGHVARLHRKWNVGVIAIWYPLLTSDLHRPMLRALEAQNLPDALRHEVRFPPVREGHRMIGSGMFVLNAPYGLAQAAKDLSAHFK